MLNPFKHIRFFRPRLLERIRNYQLRELHKELFAANSERERERVIVSWSLSRRIDTYEDREFSRAYGIYGRMRWYDNHKKIAELSDENS